MYRKFFSTSAVILALLIFSSAIFSGCTNKPVEQGSTTTTNTTEKTENNVTSDNTEDLAYVPNVTFSAEVAEVKGVIYTTRKATKTASGMFDINERNAADDIPTCKVVPIETAEDEAVSSFCYYDKYIYYIVSTSGSSEYSTRLYRCNSDWTNNELICEELYDYESEFPTSGARDFVIDSGYLYYGNNAFDLPSLAKVEKDYPQYSVPGNNNDRCYISIFEDMIFYDDYSDDANRKLYYYDGNESKLIAENAVLDGGYACGYLYFARTTETSSGIGAVLCRYNMQTGETEEIHQIETIADDDGPYFSW